jgi:hypothetical protein
MLRYYPTSKVLTNQKAGNREYINTKGEIYTGKYYITYDGKAFSGPSPDVGPSEPLQKINEYPSSPILGSLNITEQQKKEIAIKTNVSPTRVLGKPVSFYPQPIESDYKRGYLIRYFTKKINDTFVIEISEDEYNNIVNGTTDYDIRIYQTQKILWKITGPLNSQRQSQYNIIPGIIDTNKRLTETANKTFLGIVDYIGGDYTKYAKPTA